MLRELQPQYDSRQSFYGKARVEQQESGGIIEHKLISYSTHVASVKYGITDSSKTVEVYGTYSSTTLRHIKEFLRQNGFKAEGKAQIERDYMTGGK